MRRLLDEAFQGTISFDPITVEPIIDYYGEDSLKIVVVYDGEGALLDPNILSGEYGLLRHVPCPVGERC